ncbi:MAG: hypothetical protein PUF57_03400, partial [Clostridiaceae bacterium]|nr:hypothetical protein [Clostridiaceae bacterium]
IKASVQNVEKSTSGLLGKIKKAFVKAADQNDDGKFAKDDVASIAGKAGETVKTVAQSLKESAEEKSRQIEKTLYTAPKIILRSGK